MQYGFILLSGSAESKDLPGTVVESVGHLIQISLAEAFHRCFLQEILAQQPVGVLVSSALPG